jgi:hypothetical protein
MCDFDNAAFHSIEITLLMPENLERVLSSTNLIENLFSRVREIGR